jgi:hypothetical protein
MYTYKQISKKYNIKVSILTKRVYKLGIKGKVLSTDATIFFSEGQIMRILMSERMPFKNHPRKIQIIELYKKGVVGRLVAETLKISTKLTYDCIREYNKDGFIIVESKINNNYIF